MFQNIYNLVKGLKNIFGIKSLLTIIQKNFNSNLSILEQETKWLELRSMIFESGSLYIKFLQWYISKLKSNILDTDTIETRNLSKFVAFFEDIFENCPFHSLDDTINIFINEGGMIGIPMKNYIDMSTIREIASGSIGQVYYARRKKDGLEVAIKVKHPDIVKNLEENKSVIRFISYLQSFQYIRKRYNLVFDIQDFLTDLQEQCDFNNEANNCKKFRENFKDSSRFIIFPKIIFQSEDILISEYIHGHSFNELTPTQKNITTLNFMCFFYQMLFVDNFIHGDLHCKNWKVRIHPETNLNDGTIHSDNENTSNVQLIIYDCGICFKNIDANTTRDFWFSLGKYDIPQLSSILKKFIITSNENISIENIEQEISKLFQTILENSVGTSMLMKSIINYFTSHNILIHKFLLNFSITICLLEEFFRYNDVVNREKTNTSNTVSMYDLINEGHMDIITFCKVKKCYPKVLEIFQNELENKYNNYCNNIKNNNLNENGKQIKPTLFNCLELSGLVMRPPE
jgi:predicted unusual protein kinase regulating ubiquinone biosynthesis (AarF/ABC1/UbiB family)